MAFTKTKLDRVKLKSNHENDCIVDHEKDELVKKILKNQLKKLDVMLNMNLTVTVSVMMNSFHVLFLLMVLFLNFGLLALGGLLLRKEDHITLRNGVGVLIGKLDGKKVVA